MDRRFFREAVNVERVLNELGESVRSIVEVQPLLATVTRTISNACTFPASRRCCAQNGDFVPAHAIGFASAPLVKFSALSPVAERMARSRDAESRVPLRVSESWPEREMEDRKQLERLGSELLLPLAVKDRLLGIPEPGPETVGGAVFADRCCSCCNR